MEDLEKKRKRFIWIKTHPVLARFVWHLPGLLVGFVLFVTVFALGGKAGSAIAALVFGYALPTAVAHCIRLFHLGRMDFPWQWEKEWILHEQKNKDKRIN